MNGLMRVYFHHLTNAEGNYLTYNESKQKYPDVKTNFLMYEGIIDAIREYQQRVKIELTTQWIWNETKLWSFKKVIKVFYH